MRSARDDAGRSTARRAEPRQREQTAAVRSRRDALGGITAAPGAPRRARRRRTPRAWRRSQRTRAEPAPRRAATLTRLLAERPRAARAAGPGGPWAIPWPIVQCESGGQNLPPNCAGASGYYQMLATWRGLGGSTPHAYQASKAEQDRLAAQLWAGGAGARNWVCAALVDVV